MLLSICKQELLLFRRTTCGTRNPIQQKREAILTAIRSSDAHPSAEWIYHTLKSTHPDLSLGTVYRNLLFFQQNGTIQSVGVVNGQERFDAVTAPHSHFVCTSCGAVIDLHRIPMDPALTAAVREQYGFEVQRHELTFYGRCQKCMQKRIHEEDLLA